MMSKNDDDDDNDDSDNENADNDDDDALTLLVGRALSHESIVVANLIGDGSIHKLATIDGYFVVLMIHLSPLIEVSEV